MGDKFVQKRASGRPACCFSGKNEFFWPDVQYYWQTAHFFGLERISSGCVSRTNPYKKNHKNSPTAMIIDIQTDTSLKTPPDTSPKTPPDTPLTDTDNEEWTTVQRKSKNKSTTKYYSELNYKNDGSTGPTSTIYDDKLTKTKMTDDDTEMTDETGNWAATKLKHLLSTEDTMDTDSVDTQITQNTTEILESFSTKNQDSQTKNDVSQNPQNNVNVSQTKNDDSKPVSKHDAKKPPPKPTKTPTKTNSTPTLWTPILLEWVDRKIPSDSSIISNQIEEFNDDDNDPTQKNPITEKLEDIINTINSAHSTSFQIKTSKSETIIDSDTFKHRKWSINSTKEMFNYKFHKDRFVMTLYINRGVMPLYEFKYPIMKYLKTNSVYFQDHDEPMLQSLSRMVQR